MKSKTTVKLILWVSVLFLSALACQTLVSDDVVIVEATEIPSPAEEATEVSFRREAFKIGGSVIGRAVNLIGRNDGRTICGRSEFHGPEDILVRWIDGHFIDLNIGANIEIQRRPTNAIINTLANAARGSDVANP